MAKSSLYLYLSKSRPRATVLGSTSNFFARSVWCNKGSIANLIMFLIMIAGIIWVSLSDGSSSCAPKLGSCPHRETRADTVGKYVLSLGLFGWAGAVTNWLAVHMLFEKVPLIVSPL